MELTVLTNFIGKTVLTELTKIKTSAQATNPIISITPHVRRAHAGMVKCRASIAVFLWGSSTYSRYWLYTEKVTDLIAMRQGVMIYQPFDFDYLFASWQLAYMHYLMLATVVPFQPRA